MGSFVRFPLASLSNITFAGFGFLRSPSGMLKEAWESAKRRTRRHCPKCKNGIVEFDVFEKPNNIFFEGPSRLINDETRETVGVAVNESMDVRIMQNAPYAANQH
jgi:hypothetical protein